MAQRGVQWELEDGEKPPQRVSLDKVQAYPEVPKGLTEDLEIDLCHCTSPKERNGLCFLCGKKFPQLSSH